MPGEARHTLDVAAARAAAAKHRAAWMPPWNPGGAMEGEHGGEPGQATAQRARARQRPSHQHRAAAGGDTPSAAPGPASPSTDARQGVGGAARLPPRRPSAGMDARRPIWVCGIGDRRWHDQQRKRHSPWHRRTPEDAGGTHAANDGRAYSPGGRPAIEFTCVVESFRELGDLPREQPAEDIRCDMENDQDKSDSVHTSSVLPVPGAGANDGCGPEIEGAK